MTEQEKICRELFNAGYTCGLEDAKQKWISADILPEEGKDVLVWFEYFRYGSYNRLYQTMGISFTYRGKWSNFVNGESGWHQLSIIAWQPLPEPPKEGAESV